MANQYTSVFDIIGPVMVGPSSSHTAGAARIGKIMGKLFGELPDSIEFKLYESFAKTYRGHGTDIALVGGILGMEPADDRLPNALKIAYEKGVEVLFVPTKESAEHPNTVTALLTKGEHQMSVTGVSVGGGSIQITEINGFKLALAMNTPTYLIPHKDQPGVVSEVTAILSSHKINIGMMTVTREAKGQRAIMVLEVDSKLGNEELIQDIEAVSGVESASFFY